MGNNKIIIYSKNKNNVSQYNLTIIIILIVLKYSFMLVGKKNIVAHIAQYSTLSVTYILLLYIYLL